MPKKIFIASFAFIALTACNSDVAKLPKYDANIDYASTKAIVVVKINNFDYLDISRVQRIEKLEDKHDNIAQDIVVSSQPAKATEADPTRRIAQINKLDLRKLISKNPISANAYRILKPNRMLKAYSYSDAVYVIESGIYYISFLAIENADNIYYTAAPGLKSDNAVMYGAFNIKPGEVLYLGDLECQWKSTSTLKKISVLDHLSEVKEDLINSGRKDLADKIQQVQFFPRGSQINHNEDGSYTLIATR